MTLNAGMHAQHPALPAIAGGWTSQPGWILLDTGFGSGSHFLELWHGWRAHSSRPAVLHYVGLLSVLEAAALLARLQQSPNTRFAELVTLLAAQCYGLDAGFHRLLLEGGQLSLTLCVGDVAHSLAQLDLHADTVLAAAPEAHWDKWALKALARCCTRGTQVLFVGTSPAQALVLEAGFKVPPALDTGHGLPIQHAVYDPSWQLRSRQHTRPDRAPAPGRCAIIGAGIAGASVAHALALRGWQVDVYDSQPAPSGGAAGLPVGLVAPHHSADDSPRSRMSRAGTRLTLQHANALLTRGQDWQPGGVLELTIDGTELADVEAEVLSQAAQQRAPTGWARHGQWGDAQGLWHPHAAWIKPARLVQAWLDHPSIRFHGGIAVHSLQREKRNWQLRDAQGIEVGSAELVVIANAYGSVELLPRVAAELPADFAWIPGALEKLERLQSMPGTLSFGASPAPGDTAASVLPGFPVNGHGSFVSAIPTAQGLQWYAGSTFQADAALHADLEREHAINVAKLQALLPQVADLLAPQFASQQVHAWQGTRCISHDRLPLVGPLEDAEQPTLWMCAAMGARGLSFSALCAELLVAWLGHEPLPMESQMAKALCTRRPLRKKNPTAA